MKIDTEIDESLIKDAVEKELVRRLREKITGHHFNYQLEDKVKVLIENTVKEEMKLINLSQEIRGMINKNITKILEDTARRQIKDIVRIATRNELAAIREEQNNSIKE